MPGFQDTPAYWTWIDPHGWIEVYRENQTRPTITRSGRRAYFNAVDRRLRLGGLYLDVDKEIYAEKPDWEPPPKGGDLIHIDVKRTVKFTLERQQFIRGRSSSLDDDLYPNDTDYEMIGDSDFITVRLVVESIGGYDHTHYCAYCEEYATSDPKGVRCEGCGKQEWVEWPDDQKAKVKVGDKFPR